MTAQCYSSPPSPSPHLVVASSHQNTGWKTLTRHTSSHLAKILLTPAMLCSSVDRSVFIFLVCLQPLQCGHQTTTNSQASLLSLGFPNFTPPAKTRPATLMRPHLLCSDRAKSHVISYKEQTRNFSACCRQPLLYFPQNIFNCLRLLLYSLSMFLRFIKQRVIEINKMTTLA